ncbi:MAG: sigma-54 dependent transcriptional regulator [Gammaproteobacteria bacterium]
MSEERVILVDDEPHVLRAGQQTLELAGFEVIPCTSAEEALRHLERDWPGVVITDVKMPHTDGFGLLAQLRRIDPDLPVVMVTGHGDITMAVQAIREGAYDFIEKPYRAELLADVAKRAIGMRRLVLENRALRSELDGQPDAPRIIGKSPPIERLRQIIANVADTDADVLILGETGTGKELVARSLHAQSSRRDKRFVALNCGAIPEALIESELFGHEAGAFTNATKRRIGRFEHADGGTVFLDEIESMPLALQVRLLRVLQERVIERLGSNDAIPVDVRIVAATKVDLRDAVARGTFREDLLYRLDVVRIEIPPLRKRIEDAPLLFEYFLSRACARYGRMAPPLSETTIRQLMSQEWPGNVRELQNAAERFALGCYEPEAEAPGELGDPDERVPLPDRVERFEKSLIVRELERQQGNIKATYEALGLPRKTLYDKMKKYGIERGDFIST